MTSHQEQSITELLTETQNELRDFVDGKYINQWTYQPPMPEGWEKMEPVPPRPWTIQENCEHLLLTERSIITRLRDPGSLATVKQVEETAGKDVLVPKRMADRTGKAKAAEAFQPKCVYPSGFDFVADFLKQRQATIVYAMDSASRVMERVMPHGRFGDLNGHQWLLVICHHTRRHLAQMTEITLLPGYPLEPF